MTDRQRKHARFLVALAVRSSLAVAAIACCPTPLERLPTTAPSPARRPQPGSAPPPAPTPIRLSYLADADMPRGLAVDGHAFGGISALAHLGETRMLALSDAHLVRAPSRMFELDVSLEQDELRIDVARALLLGGVFESTFEDPEGMALLPDGSLLIASEGDGKADPPLLPSLWRMTQGGRPLAEVVVPPVLRQRARFNKSFEGLSASPSGGRVALASEHPLTGDGDEASFERGGMIRIALFDRTLTHAAQLAYRTDPVPPDARSGRLDTAQNGVSALTLLDDDTLLVLERGVVAYDGVFVNTVRIYGVALAGIEDVSAHESLDDTTGVAEKTLVLDLATLVDRLATPKLDNFEAMALGPRHERRRTLLVASDDNFKDSQRTVFVALAIDR